MHHRSNLPRAVAALCLTAALAPAQYCLDAPGTAVLNGAGPDVVLPQEMIGFAFPFAGQTYTHLHICDKGYAFLSNNGVPAPSLFADFEATPNDLQNLSPRICPLWSDVAGYTANGAQIRVARTPSECTVTWENLQVFAGGLINGQRFDLQMRLQADGTIVFDYDGSARNGSIPTQPTWQAGIVGVSPGGGVALPPAGDFGAGFTTADDSAFEVFPLTGDFDLAGTTITMTPTSPGWNVTAQHNQCAVSRTYGDPCAGTSLTFGTSELPFLGNTTFAFEVSGVENLVPFAFLIFGDQELLPGVDLTAIGMTGCAAYTNGNLGIYDVPVWQPSGTASRTFPLPSDPAIVGAGFTCQALAFSSANPFGIAASNGLTWRVGY